MKNEIIKISHNGLLVNGEIAPLHYSNIVSKALECALETEMDNNVIILNKKNINRYTKCIDRLWDGPDPMPQRYYDWIQKTKKRRS